MATRKRKPRAFDAARSELRTAARLDQLERDYRVLAAELDAARATVERLRSGLQQVAEHLDAALSALDEATR